jgi:hypothetical protein
VNNGQRLLPRGAIFEASSKLERVSLPDRHVAGLIKLSDESGWAMVPTVDELKLQYQQMIHRSGLMNDDGTSAVEEVGNATLDTSESPLDCSKRVFLRILPRNGVVISCASSSSHMYNVKPKPQPITSPSSVGKTNASLGCFGSKYNTEMCGRDSHSVAQTFPHDDKFASSRRGVFPKNPTFLLGTSVIPCGLVVEVEPWEENLSEVLKPITSDVQQSVSIQKMLALCIGNILMFYFELITKMGLVLNSNFLCDSRLVDGSQGICTVNQSISEFEPLLKCAVDHFGSVWYLRTG